MVNMTKEVVWLLSIGGEGRVGKIGGPSNTGGGLIAVARAMILWRARSPTLCDCLVSGLPQERAKIGR